MMWVCRPGQQGKYFDLFMEQSRIYLAWDGYRQDLSCMKTREEFKALVIAEKNPDARTTISNWSGQLYSFCVEMQIGDYVLIPSKGSRSYVLSRITGEYQYDERAKLPHSRTVKIIRKDIPRSAFEQSTQYSLGAFRTVFKVKQEEEILLRSETV